jgi:hypothetical protein
MTIRDFFKLHLLPVGAFGERIGMDPDKARRIISGAQEPSAREAVRIVDELTALTGESLTVADFWPPVEVPR